MISSSRRLMVAMVGMMMATAATLSSRTQPAVGAAPTLPGVGEAIVHGELKVTLLGARRVSVDECRDALKTDLMLWAGGGARFAFLVEGPRAGSLSLDDVRVLVGAESHPYNDETNAASGKPFAPFAIVRPLDDFASTAYGREIKNRIPTPAPPAAVVLELLVRGGTIPARSEAVVELGQAFRFRVASLD